MNNSFLVGIFFASNTVANSASFLPVKRWASSAIVKSNFLPASFCALATWAED